MSKALVTDVDDPLATMVCNTKSREDMIFVFRRQAYGPCNGPDAGKRYFLPDEHGESLALMKRVKDFLDPDGLMSPGKFFL